MKKLLKIPLGLELPKEMELKDWVDQGAELYRRAEELTWHLADWAAFGEKKYGRLKEFCEARGLNFGTLRVYAYVASNVDFVNRFNTLSFSHHIVIAALPGVKQRVWLQKAERNGWSVAELRRQVRIAEANGRTTASDGPIFAFADKSAIELSQFLSSQPDDYWTAGMKEYWRAKLEPIVALYQRRLA
jgi:hypothetical protein